MVAFQLLAAPEQTMVAEITYRILIIEDDTNNSRLLSDILAVDYAVESATNGNEALDLLERESFHLILLDVKLPKLNGFQILDRIRRLPGGEDVPVILISALSDNQDIVRGLELGANDYIIKPFNWRVVRARVATQLALKRQLDERAEVIMQLGALNAMKDRFFRIAAHDLKGPLTNIRSAAYLLNEHIQDNSAAQDIIEDLEATVEAMQNIIQHFLEASALPGSPLELECEQFEIEEIVLQVAAQYGLSLAAQNIKLNIEQVRGCVDADARMVKHMLGNLLNNAIKYSPPHSMIRIYSEDTGNFTRICVADEGPGIKPEQRHKLFKEFSRLGHAPRNGESSTGVGLWIVEHLVTLHGGKAGVECPPEGGSIFWIELPPCLANESDI